MTMSFFVKLQYKISGFLWPHVKKQSEYKGEDVRHWDDPYDEWPILEFYRRGDPLLKPGDNTTKNKFNSNGNFHNFDFEEFVDDEGKVAQISENSYKTFNYQFLGLVDAETAIVYDGNVNKNPPEENPEMVLEKRIPSVVNPHINPAAHVRKRKIEGAESLCKLQNSDYENKRKVKHQERMKLKSKDAKPCDTIEDTLKELNMDTGRNKLPEQK